MHSARRRPWYNPEAQIPASSPAILAKSQPRANSTVAPAYPLLANKGDETWRLPDVKVVDSTLVRFFNRSWLALEVILGSKSRDRHYASLEIKRAHKDEVRRWLEGSFQVRWRVTLRNGQNSAPLLPTGPRAARTDVERWMDKSCRSSDAPIEELGQHVDGQREDDGGVLLRTYCA